MAAQHRSALPLLDASGAAARSCGARSPSGALLRHSPGRTHPPLAQLQFPRFLRPDRAYVRKSGYRFSERSYASKSLRALLASICLESTALRGDRSSCRPSGGPEPPGSGWQIRPQAPPSLRLSGLPFRKGALDERGGGVCNQKRDDCQDGVSTMETSCKVSVVQG